MKFIESKSKNPYFNLALEEYVFDCLSRNDSYFMLWQNQNTIVIGKYQNSAEEINQSFVEEKDIKVVRRLSGGGAVYHDGGNLNFTFVVPQNSLEDFNFSYFVSPVIKVLAGFGIKAKFTGRNDIVIDNKKISGNSQYAKDGRVLHHGCIMLDSNTEIVAAALNVKAAKFESKSTKSVKSRVTTINAHSKYPISMDEFKDALKKEVFGSNEVEEHILSERELDEIKKIQKSKYETWKWNYGNDRPFTVERTEKFEAGLVQCKMLVEEGKIKDIKFYGDFFGNYPIEELEQELIGITLDEELERKLESLSICKYIKGITSKEISSLIRG